MQKTTIWSHMSTNRLGGMRGKEGWRKKGREGGREGGREKEGKEGR